ncbi:DUF4328 domain-containing protein [Streptomyces sp. SID2563]|uniref:DUF4328 domain-containing protein n=1 Tax=Streptomyces sp. SID2563 TaxID=2690255 RepID=UPI00136ACD9C|nr:DUF4328 domain-containing protein [Streptomyces sp. SID2563]MYW11513.1 DUF4328 domain-containing protein [Streptomyces sp. SID2563]
MLCSICGTRPVGAAGVRCAVCAGAAGDGRARSGSTGATPAARPRLDQLRSPVGLARAVCVLLGAAAVADVLSIAAGVHSRVLIADGLDGGFLAVDEEAWTRADRLYGFAGSLQVLTFLTAGVVFLVWMRRARLNAEVFDPSAHPMKPGWAIGGWFVPIGNLWLPYRVTSGIWTASAPVETPGGRFAAPRALLNAWWAVFVADQLVSRASGRLYADAETGDEIIRGLDLVVVTDALDLVAAVLAILVVRRLTTMQSRRAELGAFPAGPRPSRAH